MPSLSEDQISNLLEAVNRFECESGRVVYHLAAADLGMRRGYPCQPIRYWMVSDNPHAPGYVRGESQQLDCRDAAPAILSASNDSANRSSLLTTMSGQFHLSTAYQLLHYHAILQPVISDGAILEVQEGIVPRLLAAGRPDAVEHLARVAGSMAFSQVAGIMQIMEDERDDLTGAGPSYMRALCVEFAAEASLSYYLQDAQTPQATLHPRVAQVFGTTSLADLADGSAILPQTKVLRETRRLHRAFADLDRLLHGPKQLRCVDGPREAKAAFLPVMEFAEP